MTHINWNVELRKIKRDYDRDYDGLLPERSRTNQQNASKPQLSERMSLVVILGQLVLVTGLAVALFWWPYGHQCGMPLVGLLGSNAMVIVGGVALCIRSWQGRMPLIFSGSALAIVAAWTVIALHTVPRLGYAPAGGTPAAWYCPASQ